MLFFQLLIADLETLWFCLDKKVTEKGLINIYILFLEN